MICKRRRDRGRSPRTRGAGRAARRARRAPPIGIQPSAYSATCANSFGPGRAADQHRRPCRPHRLRPRPRRREVHELAVERRRRRCCQSARIASTCSRAIARRSDIVTPWSLDLVGVPPESRCRARTGRPRAGRGVATALAVTIGSRCATRQMPVPTTSRSVAAAAIASATNGSSVRLYSSRSSASPVGGGRAPARRDVRVLGHVERVQPALLDRARERRPAPSSGRS